MQLWVWLVNSKADMRQRIKSLVNPPNIATLTGLLFVVTGFANDVPDLILRPMTAIGSMTPELVPRECIGRWRGLISLFTGLVSIPAPIIGGYIWAHLGPAWVFIIPTLIDLLVRLPLIHTVPETLHRKGDALEAP